MDTETAGTPHAIVDITPDVSDIPYINVERDTENKKGEKCEWLEEDAWMLHEETPLVSDGNHWAVCRDILVQHDTELVGEWKTGIQNQLVVVRRHSVAMDDE